MKATAGLGQQYNYIYLKYGGYMVAVSPNRKKHTVYGPSISSYEAPEHKLDWKLGQGEFSPDAISSMNYSLQEVSLVIGSLAVVNVVFYQKLTLSIMAAILGVLWLLVLTYGPTILTYTKRGGGAYIVIDQNIGRWVARVVAAMALGEYVLTASVSSSAAAGAMVTSLPFLLPFRMYLALLTNLVLWYVNRVGMQNASKIFMPIVWGFVGVVVAMGVTAIAKYSLGFQFFEVQHVGEMSHTAQTFSIFVMLKAFSNGCSALTGVEATSDRSNAFHSPKEAYKSLVASAIMITVGTISIVITALLTGIVPHEGEAMLVLLAQCVWGPMGKNIIALAAYLILFAAGSVSFADFPQVLCNMARNREAPRQFKFEGQRALVYDYGCNLLLWLSSFMIYVFDGKESPQIPLYSVGVFFMVMSSQLGMAIHWWRVSKLQPDEVVETDSASLRYVPNWKLRLWINIAATIVVGVVFIIIATTKFHDGAWVMLLVNAPILTFFQWYLGKHYKRVAVALKLSKPSDVCLNKVGEPIVILAGDVTRQLENQIRKVGGDQYIVHVWTNPERRDKFMNDLAELMPCVDLDRVILVEAIYRDLFDPALEGVKWVEKFLNRTASVVIGSLETKMTDVASNWLHRIMHMQTGNQLSTFFGKEGYSVIVVPFFL